MAKGNVGKIAILIAIAAFVTIFFQSGLNEYFSFDYIKSNRTQFATFYATNQALTITAYMVVYILVTAASLPGATVMTLLGGALFGLGLGTVMVSFASTIGATIAFLVARYIFRDPIQRKFADRLTTVNKAFEKEGAFYLFSARLIPAIPFFVINVVMALTPIKTWTFYWVSQVGMLIGTIVYVNAGTQISKIDSASGLLSPGLIGSFVLLGITPLLLKRIMGYVRAKRPGAAAD